MANEALDRRCTPGWAKALTASILALALCCGVLAFQLTRRNASLDDLERNSEETRDLIEDVRSETHRIGAIADDFADGDPDQSAALQEIFRKIDAIYQATVPGADVQEEN